MKIKELATELHITPQAVQKRMANIPDFKKKHTKKVNNRIIIDPEGVKILKQSIQGKQSSSKDNDKNELTESVISILREQLKVKDEQISNRDYQIAALTNEISKANDQIRELTTGEHPTIEMKTNKAANKEKHTSVWQRFKKAFSSDNDTKE